MTAVRLDEAADEAAAAATAVEASPPPLPPRIVLEWNGRTFHSRRRLTQLLADEPDVHDAEDAWDVLEYAPWREAMRADREPIVSVS